MKLKPFNLQRKLFITIFAIVFICIAFAYGITQMLYEKLYVNYVRDNLKMQASEIALEYEGGELTDEFKEQVEWLNNKITGEMVVVNNPKELSSCLPFEVDYQSLISGSDREKLLKGNPIYKKGYEETFDRDVVAVIYPLLDNERLEAIIYSYVPLTSITVITQGISLIWIASAILFIIVLFFFVEKIVKKIFQPLKDMEKAAIKVSLGDYTTVSQEGSNDEIGRLAKAFNHMSKAMEEEEERVKTFLSDISHELRTPLSYIKGYTSAMLDGIIKNEDEQKKYLRLIERETSQLQVQLQDLMDLINMDSNMLVLNLGPVAFAQFIGEVLETYESILKTKDICLYMDLDPDVIINGDERRLEQIIINIVENAIRYTNPGGNLYVKLFSEGQSCTLMIEDTGMGIAEEHLSKVTERFYRVNKARTRYDGGSGLGLSIVAKLIGLHNGKIRFESKVDVGTKVFLTFPLIGDSL